MPRRLIPLTVAILFGALVLAGCGSSSDGASDDSTTTEATATDDPATTEADDPSSEPAPEPGPTVEIPLSPTSEIERTMVDVGSPAVMGPMTVTLRSISPGDEPADEALNTAGSVDLDVMVENTANERLTGPQFSTSCASGGAAALSIVGSEVGSLARMSGGEVLDGIAEVKIPAGCDAVVVQIRGMPETGEGEYLAGYEVPASALP